MLSDHDIARFRDVLRQELRKELTSGDAGVASPLLLERVRSIFKTRVRANTNIFADDYTVPHACILRLVTSLDTGTLLRYILTRDTRSVKIDLNAGDSLTENAAYVFDIPFKDGDGVNFQVYAACTVLQLDVYKIRLVAP